MRILPAIIVLLAVAALTASVRLGLDAHAAPDASHAHGQVLNLVYGAPGAQEDSLVWLEQNWRADTAGMLIESMRYIRSPRTRRGAADLLDARTGVQHGLDVDAWYHWLWQQDYEPHPGYALFKTALYARLDPRFVPYFDDVDNARIRLDEIRWGGVRQNGIPPLRQPAMLKADDAGYLDDDNLVFAVDINGDARAYPMRIMGHHEMFIDSIGGIPVTGVYCTLCGAMIIYQSDGHKLGTSGFLYRSNKLMFDEDTNSLWSTLLGYPVVGPLVDKGIVLRRHPVVTTTWGQWRARHPDSKVLDIDTGFRRDYAEGAAYSSYFSNDNLMFTIPEQLVDPSLANKAEILALREGDDALAISAEFLDSHRVYHDQLAGRNIVVVTDKSGANRVYATQENQFERTENGQRLIDSKHNSWQVLEGFLLGPNGQELPRVPAHRAFWFGWKAAVPDTRLVH